MRGLCPTRRPDLRLETQSSACYDGDMAKTRPTPSPGRTAKPAATKVVRDARTGASVTVKGFGALKGSALELGQGIDLLKPIAEQAFAPRRGERTDP